MISILVNELDVMGGTHKQVLRLAEFLKDEEENFEIITKRFNIEKTYPEFKYFNIKNIKNIPSRKNYFLKFLNDIYAQIKIFRAINEESKIVNVHDNGFPLVIILCKLTGKQVFWQINDLPWCFSIGNSKSFQYGGILKLFQILSKWMYSNIISKCVEQITVNVTKNKERVKEYLNRDSHVLYCGVDNWEGGIIDRKYNNKKIKLLSSGVFFPYRNYETQIELVLRMIKLGYDVNLNIIGSIDVYPSYYEKIDKMIDDKGLSKNIIIHGQVSQEKYISLHEESDIFLFINIDQSWGLAVFEAMGSGMPVIVSNSVGASEILSHKTNSLVTDPTNLRDIIENILFLGESDNYVKIAKSGQDFVKSLTWDKTYSSKLVKIMKGNN